jgi:hypothetical protein
VLPGAEEHEGHAPIAEGTVVAAGADQVGADSGDFDPHTRGQRALFLCGERKSTLSPFPGFPALQQVYGPYGLEVVGIAYEEGTFAQQVQKVNRIREVKRVN